ncbi:MAG TPA: HEAT repeat domain-containing protein [Candidatus Acidoferrum sp.]|nr:HEAT repeat domain-containing protein [Candidatus Acidoferrum sp.]
MSDAGPMKTCAEIASLLVFYACDEVNAAERVAIDAHLTTCEDCRAQLAEENAFQEAVGAIPQAAESLDSASVLLAQCRSELAEKLDDLAIPPVKEKAPAFLWLRRWMALHPAWSGALLVLFGLVAGVESTQWFTGRNDANALDQAVNVRPGPRITQEQLAKMAVAGVNLTPSMGSGTQNVRLQLSAEQPVVLTGDLDDADVRQVLMYVVENGDRFDSGVRLDCLDVLKARAKDVQVRGALLTAARKDRNPAVRLKALESLRDATPDRMVRETLLEALQQDSNPGVRVEAVNLLVRSLDAGEPDSAVQPVLGDLDAPEHELAAPRAPGVPPDESLADVIRALQDLRRKDPSQYVRLRSSAALREIGERGEQ